MLTRATVVAATKNISDLMTQNRAYLVQLDQANGDGDLGISMDDGFKALAHWLDSTDETDLGQLFRGAAKTFNESAPSSLGTILSFAMMGMAKSLRGNTEANLTQTAEAISAGVDNIMAKAESKPGEKTILDSLHPAAETLLAKAREGASAQEAAHAAAQAAATGSEATKQMTAVHGRAAYSAARSIGILDGGSVVGKLIFDGIAATADD